VKITRPKVTTPRKASGRAVRPKTLFTSAEEVAIGAVVFDRNYEMPATVRNINGMRIELERPTGFVWDVHFRRLRPATEREQRQLVAIGKLHRQQQRGLPPRPDPRRR
jgi:hypothetical protein